MADTKQLYQEVILDHNRKPRNWGTLADATHHAEGVNPLCGDRLQLGVKVGGDTIEGIAFEGESCAICKASASMMTTAVKGKPTADAEQLFEELMALKRSEAPRYYYARLLLDSQRKDQGLAVLKDILQRYRQGTPVWRYQEETWFYASKHLLKAAAA